MNKDAKDTGVILALIQRFNEQRLPRVLELQKKVNRGERLNDTDIEFLEGVFKDAKHSFPLLDKHPELQQVASRAVSLYKEITDKALENEGQS